MTNNYKMLNIEKSVFYEKINIKKLDCIINIYTSIKDIIKENEKCMRRDSKYNPYNHLKKIRQNCIIPSGFETSEYGFIKTSYNKGKNSYSNNEGRWYTVNSIGLAPLCGTIRHTICNNIWTDIDQVNSHPTILKSIMDELFIKSESLDQCLNDREIYLQKIIDEIKCTRDEAKEKVIAVINGGPLYKSKILKKLKDEIDPCIEKLTKLPKYTGLYEFVSNNYKNNINGKFISRVLQIKENEVLELYINFFIEKGFITPFLDGYEVVLIFDGLQIRSIHNITDEILNECRLYTLEQTKIDIQLKIKPFNNQLILPDNYADCIDEIESTINKYKCDILTFYEKEIDLIEKSIQTKYDYDILKVVQAFVKNKVVYDTTVKKWFFCNQNNTWKEYDEPIIIKAMLPSVIYDVYQIYVNKTLEKAFKYDILPELRTSLTNNVDKTQHLIKELKGVNLSKKIKEFSYLFVKDNFKADYLDSKTHLFAFNDVVFDFSTILEKDQDVDINNFIRPIYEEDYICTTTGYDFPLNSDEKTLNKLHKFFDSICPDTDDGRNIGKKDFILDLYSTSLNGANKEQNAILLTGDGCNAKTTCLELITSSYGKYAVSISPELFMQPMKANGNSELYKIKGKRIIISNEAEESNGNKLQSSLLKRLGEEATPNNKFPVCDKYEKSINISDRPLVNIALNKLPDLSSVDGGIARRIKVIEFLVKFKENPDINNKLQGKIDTSLITFMSNPITTFTFIRFLLDRWIVKIRLKGRIYIPNCVEISSSNYINDCNNVLKFIHENYEITSNINDKCKSSDIFNEFANWLKLNTGEKFPNDKKFKKDILDIEGITEKRMTKGVHFCGLIKIVNEDDCEEEDIK
jgi:phage/plasmid-associated DNA primase